MAVSTRRMIEPRVTGRKPAARAAAVSSGVKSPSGPMSSVAEVVEGWARSVSRKGLAPGASEAMRLRPGFSDREASQRSKGSGSAMAGRVSWPHCLQASSAVRRHLSDLPSPGWTMVFFVTSGWMAATPSSTAFWTMRSMFFPLGIAWARVMAGRGGGGVMASPSFRETSSRETLRTSASARRPQPSKTVTFSPARMRSTWARCLASSPVRVADCQESGGRWKRGMGEESVRDFSAASFV